MLYKVLVILFIFNITNAEGAILAVAWNSELRTAINKIISGLGNEHSSTLSVYSGAQVTFSDGVYRHYVKGEPTLSLGAELKQLDLCLVFTANGSTVEVDCKEQYPYICYAPMPACGNNNESRAKYDLTCTGYTFSNQTEHCYKFHANKVNWTTAYNACREEGAHLAIINSAAEAQILKKLYPNGGYDKANIGFYYWEAAGAWWTVKGETIEQAGFTLWTHDEPTPKTFFGAFQRNGTLYSHRPMTIAPFFCEKLPALKQA